MIEYKTFHLPATLTVICILLLTMVVDGYGMGQDGSMPDRLSARKVHRDIPALWGRLVYKVPKVPEVHRVPKVRLDRME